MFCQVLTCYSRIGNGKLLMEMCCSLQALVEFFGTLSREWALECMKDLLLVNLRGNLQIIVQVHHVSFKLLVKSFHIS